MPTKTPDAPTVVLPATIESASQQISTVAALADIPEEEIWLAKQKSARTRRAYKQDVRHFMRTLPEQGRLEIRIRVAQAWLRFISGSIS